MSLCCICERGGLSETLGGSLAAISLVGSFLYKSITHPPPVSLLLFSSGRSKKVGSLGEARMHKTKFEAATGSI